MRPAAHPAGSTANPAADTPARRPVPVRFWLPVGVVLALIAGLLAWDLTTPQRAAYNDTSSIPRISTGAKAPSFRLPALAGGGTVDLSSYAGKPVVLNFFASWCRNCRGELGAFAVSSRQAAGAVDFVGIDTGDQSPATAAALLRRAGADYPVGVDADGKVANLYQVTALPTTVFLTRSGVVAGVHIGAESAAGLRSWIERLERSS